MPKRTDISKIMIIGSGPIVIGQGCEFDYSGTQACKALREEGYDVILINSNPATIMTDLVTANKTYIEPVTPKVVKKIIEREFPDAILPTLGGQTALNTVLSLSKIGILEQFGIEIIGASLEAIEKSESRDKFSVAMNKIGFRVAKSGRANTICSAIDIAEKIGYPLIIRASFALGGAGSSFINNINDLEKFVVTSLQKKSVSHVVLEESLTGWKEYELEMMRDSSDNVIVICSIENFDPMGIHTGDSITVAPIQTLTDKEYQSMRNDAIDIIREIGVDTGGANVQFAVNPVTGERVVVEMNPRVSRSSALASKATGFPIAKIAAKLAVGYNLYEIKNDITGETMVCFEPSIDYCVVKIPVWEFDKFPDSKDVLTTMMKSVGETMAIGRTFKEAIQKAIRALGIGLYGFGSSLAEGVSRCEIPQTVEEVKKKLKSANSKRLLDIYYAFCFDMDIRDISNISGVDSWFIFQLYQIFKVEVAFSKLFANDNYVDSYCTIKKLKSSHTEALMNIKADGFSDIQIASLIGVDEKSIAECRQTMGIQPVYKAVDTCAAEFFARSPYYYSTYETECEVGLLPSTKRIVILGSGPNRIGQGIEFDYCCVHASLALREEGVESIMINSNPETVSTDYDISDRLYFEPLTYEDIMGIIYKENPYGIIVQFGGQIPLNLSALLESAGVSILGTQVVDINRAEDRGLFQKMINKLNLNCPRSVVTTSLEHSISVAETIGYPLMIRPSFVLGGRAINIAYDLKSLKKFIDMAFSASCGYPVVIDEFLEKAVEVDVDAIRDGDFSVICGIMEHVEEAGIHSGDSACVLPPQNIASLMLDRIIKTTELIAQELNIVGFINIQYAIKENKLYVLEVNPRASRTIPFVSKATGVSFANLATKVILGNSLSDLGVSSEVNLKHVAVKESIFPFDRFENSDVLLGPTMKSTGEVMGIGSNFEDAYAKAQLAAGQPLPLSGTVFIDCDSDNYEVVSCLIARYKKLGFDILLGECGKLVDFGVIRTQVSFKDYFSTIAAVESYRIQLVIVVNDINKLYESGYKICRAALRVGVPYITTVSGALAAAQSIEFLLKDGELKVESLQNYHS